MEIGCLGICRQGWLPEELRKGVLGRAYWPEGPYLLGLAEKEGGAGRGNRTLTDCLGSNSCTIQLYPHHVAAMFTA